MEGGCCAAEPLFIFDEQLLGGKKLWSLMDMRYCKENIRKVDEGGYNKNVKLCPSKHILHVDCYVYCFLLHVQFLYMHSGSEGRAHPRDVEHH